MTEQMLRAIDAGLNEGIIIPYLGPGILALAGERPTALHNYLATLPVLPLVVHGSDDDLPQKALAIRSSWSVWGMVQGTGDCGSDGSDVECWQADGIAARNVPPDAVKKWSTLLYRPLGPAAPRASAPDSDFIKLPDRMNGPAFIPQPVKNLRAGRQFLFLGCRFSNERDRMFVRRIMERCSAMHWAVLPETPTADEERFLAAQNIQRIELDLPDFVATLAETRRAEKMQLLQASW